MKSVDENAKNATNMENATNVESIKSENNAKNCSKGGVLSKSGITILCTILFYISLHTLFYIIEQIHYSFCTPYGLSGFIQSFFTSRSAVCDTLKTVSWHASNASANMLYFGLSLIGGVLVGNTKRTSN